MSRQTFINDPEDMEWLEDVHGIRAKSAIIHGNEDAPDEVHAYSKRDPEITDKAVFYRPDEDGVLRRV